MRRGFIVSLGVLALLCAPLALQAQDPNDDTVFTLGFAGPSLLTGVSGAAVGAAYDCTLARTGGEDGAQGWSISVVADNASITDMTTAGTVAALVADGGLQKGGFESVELTPLNDAETPSVDECAGKAGAVEAVVLSFKLPITLPLEAEPYVIAKLQVEAVIPDGPADDVAGELAAALRYADGCRGSGQKVDNNVTQVGTTKKPVKGSFPITILEKISCAGDGKINVGFSSQKLVSADVAEGTDPLDILVGDEGAGGEIAVEVAPGATGVTDVYANVASNLAEGGVQGWSLSIALSGQADFSREVDEFGTLVDITTAGTSAAPVPSGLQKGGFESVEVVDANLEPASGPLAGKGPQGNGVVTAIVLSFKLPIVLPRVGVESVLKMKLIADEPQAEDADQVATLSFKDGLQGAGQPVLNVFTVGGATKQGCNTKTAAVAVRFTPSTAKKFVYGNVNGDAKINIADVVWFVNEFFRDGPSANCDAALDFNGDDTLDASDPVFLLDYLFGGSGNPPPSIGECVEATGALTCEQSTPGC